MFRYSAHDDADTLNLFDEGFQGRTALSLFTVNALSQLPSVDMNWTNRYKARKKPLRNSPIRNGHICPYVSAAYKN